VLELRPASSSPWSRAHSVADHSLCCASFLHEMQLLRCKRETGSCLFVQVPEKHHQKMEGGDMQLLLKGFLDKAKLQVCNGPHLFLSGSLGAVTVSIGNPSRFERVWIRSPPFLEASYVRFLGGAVPGGQGGVPLCRCGCWL
jgi:hypothetical protein